MPDSRAGKESPREEPGNATPPEGTEGQDQDGPRGHDGKTFLHHAEDVMNEHN